MIDVVCGVIENAVGELLACQRPAGKHLAGLWEFPGGKVDPGESPEAALNRELWEELNVEVEVLSSLQPVEWAYDGICIRLLPYRCRIKRGTPQAIVHDALVWVARNDWERLAWAAADVPVLRELFTANAGGTAD